MRKRTLAHLRADVLADLVTDADRGSDAVGHSGTPSARGAAPPHIETTPHVEAAPRSDAASADAAAPATAAVRIPPASPTVVVTIPVLTLLGVDDQPATLDGYGPIDLDAARRLAGEARSWVRLLTHPVTGAPLVLDRQTYRVPAALRRWLGVTSPTCVFPGCARTARDCDLDHLTAWADGGPTDADDLAPECRHHHRLRHETRWTPTHDPVTGDLSWTSPLGGTYDTDPPPF